LPSLREEDPLEDEEPDEREVDPLLLPLLPLLPRLTLPPPDEPRLELPPEEPRSPRFTLLPDDPRLLPPLSRTVLRPPPLELPPESRPLSRG
jgi:hypothetical protein